jgi:hypothetical protein
MRFGLTLTAAAMGAVLVAGSVLAAAPAHASSPYVEIQPGTGQQYIKSCLSASACNQTAAGDVELSFSRSGSLTQPLGVFYKVINGTAVNGVDFNTPATGEAIIPAGLTYAFVEVPLVNEGMFGSTKTFTSQITGTSSPIKILISSTTDTILGGNVPTDCSYTFLSDISQSLTCTSRPATQVWQLGIECGLMHGALGTDVTGDGTSTVSGCEAQHEFFETS